MTALGINGNLVFFCQDPKYRALILSALGCKHEHFPFSSSKEKSQPVESNTPKKSVEQTIHNDECYFVVHKKQSFKVMDNFQSVMVDDKIFHKHSFHMDIVDVKEKYQKQGREFSNVDGTGINRTNSPVNERTKMDIYKKLPIECVTVSHFIYKKPKISDGITSTNTSTNTNTTATTNAVTVLPKLKISDIKHRSLSEIYTERDLSFVEQQKHNHDDESEDSSSTSSTGQYTNETISELQKSSTFSIFLDNGKKLSNYDKFCLNFIPIRVPNSELMEILDRYTKEEWKEILLLVDQYNLSFADAREMSHPIKNSPHSFPSTLYPTSSAVLGYTNKFIGLSVLTTQVNQICNVDLFIHEFIEMEDFVTFMIPYILKTSNAIVGANIRKRISSQNISDATTSSDETTGESSSENSDSENMDHEHRDVVDFVGPNTTTPNTTTTTTTPNISPLLTPKIPGFLTDIPLNFQNTRPKNPLCYVVFANLDVSDSGQIAETKAILSIIRDLISIDSLPEPFRNIFVQKDKNVKKDGQEANHTAAHNDTAFIKLKTFLTKQYFDKNKTFVAIIAHSPQKVIKKQIEKKISSIQNKEDDPTIKTDDKNNNNNNSNNNNTNNSSTTNLRSLIYRGEKNCESIFSHAKKCFSNHFVFINIDCSIPLQVVMAFQKISTIIMRQYQPNKERYHNKTGKTKQNTNISHSNERKSNEEEKILGFLSYTLNKNT